MQAFHIPFDVKDIEIYSGRTGKRSPGKVEADCGVEENS